MFDILSRPSSSNRSNMKPPRSHSGHLDNYPNIKRYFEESE